MKRLGYIVTDKKLTKIDGCVEQVNDISLADSTRPILVVGWKNAKKYSGYKSILDKTLGDNIYWTFSRSESRSDFEQDLRNFYDIVYNNILKNIKYIYIDISRLKYSKIKKLYNIIYSKDIKNIYISNNLIYIPYEGNVLGISLDIFEYCRISKEKVINKIKSNPSNIIFEDDDKAVFKVVRQLGNKKYALPYFIST
jgi:hypothetical protein